MASGQKDEVWDLPLQPTAVLLLGAAKTFSTPMEGRNALQLNCNYTRSAGTALSFAFTVQEPNDPGQNYSLKKTDVAAGTVASASFTYTTAVTERFAFVVPLTGANMQCTVTGTATTNSDTMVVYPHALVVG